MFVRAYTRECIAVRNVKKYTRESDKGLVVGGPLAKSFSGTRLDLWSTRRPTVTNHSDGR